MLMVALRDIKFDDFLIYAGVLLQYVGEVETNFNEEIESPGHPDEVIANGFTSKLLVSLDKTASEFWASMRPYFLAYVLRGPAMATSSLKSFAQKYSWGKSSAHWEQGISWLDLDLPEVWRRHVNICGIADGQNESVKEAHMSKNVIDYVRNCLENQRFSDAAMKGDDAKVGKNPYKHFMWEVFEQVSIERARVERTRHGGEEFELRHVEDCCEHGNQTCAHDQYTIESAVKNFWVNYV